MKKNLISDYYDSKAIQYGISKARLKHTLDLIPAKSQLRILDIGCATGYVGKLLKENRHYVVGFDISKKAIKKAKIVLDEAYVVDIEQKKLPVLRKFDVLILSEVIEHLFQPEKTIKKLSNYIKPKGTLIISTPNFLYWGYRIQFLKGNFNYSHVGAFDEGHIHFFTYHSLRSLLKVNNFVINKEHHLTAGICSKLLVRRFPSLFAYHLLVSAKKR